MSDILQYKNFIFPISCLLIKSCSRKLDQMLFSIATMEFLRVKNIVIENFFVSSNFNYLCKNPKQSIPQIKESLLLFKLYLISMTKKNPFLCEFKNSPFDILDVKVCKIRYAVHLNVLCQPCVWE